MSGFVPEELTPEEEAAIEKMFTLSTYYFGKSGFYREVGERDGRNNWQAMTVPAEDSSFQQYYDQGYADGQYWAKQYQSSM